MANTQMVDSIHRWSISEVVNVWKFYHDVWMKHAGVHVYSWYDNGVCGRYVYSNKWMKYI